MMLAADSEAIARRNSSIGLCLTLFIVSYHIGVVPAIMPPLVRDLDSSVGYVQGALVMLSLITASFTPTSETLSQRFGRQGVFRGGLLLFAIGTLLTCFSPTMGLFVVSYSLLTGIAATPLVSVPWALMDSLYDDKAEKNAFLALTLSTVTGGLVGSLLGGLVAFKYSWRITFPLEIILIPLIFYLFTLYPPKNDVKAEPIDWVGGLLSFLGLGLTLLGISLAGELGWWFPKKEVLFFGIILTPFGISVVPILIATGIVCLGLFLYWKRQQARESRASLLSAGLLTRREFVAGLTVATTHSALTTGLSFNLFQFIPPVLNLNSLATALTILPFNLATVITLIAMVKFINIKIAPRKLVQFGLIIESVGILLLFFSIHSGLTRGSLLLALIVTGTGSGLFLSQIGSITYATASRAEKPEASGIYNPFQKVGQALGRGILGTVLVSIASIKIVDGVIADLGKSVDTATRSSAISTLERAIQTFTNEEMSALLGKLPDAVQPALGSIIDTAAISAMRSTLLIILVINLLCLAFTTRLPKRSLRVPS
jgi:MFS family permease